jgi:hypothetical protein
VEDIQGLLKDGALDGYSVEELQQILALLNEDAAPQTPALLNAASNGKCRSVQEKCN